MPTEILSTIVNLIDTNTLPALRLTNKRLCAIADGPFALEHFSERKHVASPFSMNALIEITAHPFFGKFVKTVIICGSRPKMFPECYGPAPQHRVLSSAQLRDKLNEIFSNIRRNFSSVCVGVCDNAEYCHGYEGYAQCVDTMGSWSHRMLHDHYGQDSSLHMAETFVCTFQAARTAGCEIEKIKVDIPDFEMDETLYIAHGKEVQNLLETFNTSLSEAFSLDLTAQADYCHDHLRYDHKAGKLCMSDIALEHIDVCNIFPYIQSTFDWLMRFTITQIEVGGCFVVDSDLLKIFCIPTLERLTFGVLELHTGYFEVNLWSSFLSRLSRLTTLKYLRISTAYYWFTSEDQFVLPSGRYDFDGNRSSTFRLLLSEDGDETVVLSDHTSISGELKALADRVAQMELDKVAEIERDGFVRNDIVGIFTRPGPYENIGSDEDDHDDTEDETSDEASDDSGELEGNDERDEHGYTTELPTT